MRMIAMVVVALSPMVAAASTQTRTNDCIQHQAFVPNNSYRDAVEFCARLTRCHDNHALPGCEWLLPKQGAPK